MIRTSLLLRISFWKQFFVKPGSVVLGRPVIIAGDLSVEPSVIPVTAKALKCGHLVDLEDANAGGLGVLTSPTCRFDLDGAPGTRRDFVLVFLLLLLPVLVVKCW